MKKTALETLYSAGQIFKSVEGATKYLISMGFNKEKAESAARKYIVQHQVSSTPPPTFPTPTFLNGLTKLWYDDCSNPDPYPKWGQISMQRIDAQQASSSSLSSIAPGRFEQFSSGGPDNKPYYRFTCKDTDNVWGHRSELGHENRPTEYFYEGQRKITFVSIRLPAAFNISLPTWRVIFQMKQQESINWQMAPMLTLEVRSGKWVLVNAWHDVWSTPAQNNVWTKWAFEVTYSADPNKGQVIIHADLDGDNSYEINSIVHIQTLLNQKGGTTPGIPSHLRAGIYEGLGGDSVEQADYSIWG